MRLLTISIAYGLLFAMANAGDTKARSDSEIGALLHAGGLVQKSAHAAEEVVVTDIDFIFQAIDGQPAVCGFEYRVAFRDRANMQDGLTGAYGSMEWRRVNGELSMKAKIGALAFSSITQDAIAMAPALNGFLSVGGKPIHPVQTDHCGNPGAFCAVYSPEVAMLVYASLLPHGMRPAGDLAIGVQRRAGEVETILPLELSLETFASEKFKSFIDCVKEILDRGRN